MTGQPNLTVQRGRRTGKWFILGLPGPDKKWCGPYDTKAEAECDARGLRRFYKKEGEQICSSSDVTAAVPIGTPSDVMKNGPIGPFSDVTAAVQICTASDVTAAVPIGTPSDVTADEQICSSPHKVLF